MWIADSPRTARVAGPRQLPAADSQKNKPNRQNDQKPPVLIVLALSTLISYTSIAICSKGLRFPKSEGRWISL